MTDLDCTLAEKISGALPGAVTAAQVRASAS